MSKKKIAITGATGFTGSELVRILLRHPEVEIAAITSESRAGSAFSDIHPQFEGLLELKLIRADELDASELDLIFLALPHGVSMEYVEKFHGMGIPIVDLSGDFRLSGPEVYEEWYGKKHSYTKGFDDAAYGLPELYKDRIRKASIVANPGCYPTCSLLALSPLIGSGLVETEGIVVDAKSGVTGAGVKPKPVTHFTNVNDNFSAYGLKKHRHTVEIEEVLGEQSGHAIKLQFTPHLLPVDRGILSTIYLRSKGKMGDADLKDVYSNFYADSPFVRLRRVPPTLKDVRGTNYCDIYATADIRTGRVIVLSAIDNLVKGASGQAVQNMNLLFGLEETLGLEHIPLKP